MASLSAGVTFADEVDTTRRRLQTVVQKPLVRADTSWTNAEDGFGRGAGGCIAMTDTWVIIGAYSSNTASIYEFDTSTGNWDTIADTTLSENAVTGFGYAVAITASGTYAIVGASSAEATNGQAYIYEFDVTANGWSTTAVASVTGYQSSAGFGMSVDIVDNYAIVGAASAQKVYIFERDGTNGWGATAVATFEHLASSNSLFGVSVSLTNAWAVMGQPGTQQAFIYGKNTGTGVWDTTSPVATLSEGSNNFGVTVAIGGSWLAVGDSNSGAVFVYAYSGGSWQSTALQVINPSGISRFGISLAMSNSYLMVGSTQGNGQAFFYDLADVTGGLLFSYGAVDAIDSFIGSNTGYSLNGVALTDTWAFVSQVYQSGAKMIPYEIYLVDAPSGQPSGQPSMQPSSSPSMPTGKPSVMPSGQPSVQPSSAPSAQPSNAPSSQPSVQPTSQPSVPTSQPSSKPTGQPSLDPTSAPSSQPSMAPSARPSSQPSGEPSSQPSSLPTLQPTSGPTGQPTTQPTNPTSAPSSIPTSNPTPVPDLSLVIPFLPWQPILYTVLTLTFVCSGYAIYRYFSKSHFSVMHWLALKLGWLDRVEEEKERKKAAHFSRRRVTPLKQLEEARVYKHEGVGSGGGLSRGSGKTPRTNKISPIPEYGASHGGRHVVRHTNDKQHRLSNFFHGTASPDEEAKGLDAVTPSIPSTLADRHSWNSNKRSPRVEPSHKGTENGAPSPHVQVRRPNGRKARPQLPASYDPSIY